MRCFPRAAAGALAFLAALSPSEAAAQFQPPGVGGPGGYGGFQTQQIRRPPVSPFINLAQPGFNPGITYYGIVRPQVNFRQNLQNIQGQLNTVEQQQAAQATPQFTGEIAPTGQQPAGFQTQSFYFFNNYYPVGGRGGRGGRAAMGGAASSRSQTPPRAGGGR